MCIWFSPKKEVTEKSGKSKEAKGLRNTWPLTNLVCSDFLKLILCQCLAHCIPPVPHNISHVKTLNFAILCSLKPFFLSDVSDEITSRLHSLTISGTIFALCPKIATNHTELAKYGRLQHLNWRFDSDIPLPLAVSISRHSISSLVYYSSLSGTGMCYSIDSNNSITIPTLYTYLLQRQFAGSFSRIRAE
jgi:hypothetical protein